MKDFTGRVAVITGSGAGIGRALATELAGRGARLALSDVDKERVSETGALCAAVGAEVRTYELDVSDREAMLAHADTVVSDFGRANLVVNNAGVALTSTALQMSWDDFDWLFGINFSGVVNGSMAFLPHLIASGEGQLVNVSSAASFMSAPTQSAYSAAKFAVRGWTESLRQEMLIERHPVGVTCVCPGKIKTGITRDGRADTLQTHEIAASTFEKSATTTPDVAAKKIIKGIERNKSRVLVGTDAFVTDAVIRIVGARYQTGVAALARKYNKDAAKTR